MKNKIYVLIVLCFISMLPLNVNAGLINDIYSNIVSSTTSSNSGGDSTVYLNNARDEVSTFLTPDFYGFTFASEYYMSSLIGKFNDTYYKVSFSVDLNNIKLVSYAQDAATNKVRFKYYFNNYIRSSTSDLTKIFSKATSSNNVYDNDYFGLPFYITSCYVDCDTNDNVPATTFSAKQYSTGDYWYMKINSYSGANTNWLLSRFPSDNQFWDSQHMIRFSKDNFKCDYNTGGVKNIAYGCILEKNDLYRDDNQNDKVWSFNDISSNFDIVDTDAKTMIVRGSYELDLTTGQYSQGISDEESTNETNAGATTKTTTDSDSLSLQRQQELNVIKELNDKNNSWQKNLIAIVQFIFSNVIIFYYLVGLFTFFFFSFISLPFITKKIKESMDKLTKW